MASRLQTPSPKQPRISNSLRSSPADRSPSHPASPRKHPAPDALLRLDRSLKDAGKKKNRKKKRAKETHGMASRSAFSPEATHVSLPRARIGTGSAWHFGLGLDAHETA